MGIKVREKVKNSGVFWVFINHNGKRSSRQVGSKKAAEKVKEHIEARLKLGQWLPEEEKPRAVPTLESYYQGIADTHLQIAVKESTAESYGTSFRLHILP